MLKRNVLCLIVAVGISSTVFAAPEMSMDMSKSDHQMMMMQQDMKTMQGKMMKDLGPKDAMFDKRFMDLMIVHHEGGIMMAEDALKKSDRPEIKEMAQQIITSQEKEIKQMKEWEKAWYKK